MEANRLNVIGKAWIKDNEDIKQWYSSGAAKEFKRENWSEERAENWEQHEQIGFYKLQSIIPGLNKALDNCADHYSLRDLIDKAEYYKTTGQWFDLVYLDDKNRFVILRSLKDEWLLPYRFVTIELYKNYDDANVAALNALSGESQNLLTNLGEVSVSDVQEKIRSREQEILNKKQELDAIKKEQEQRIEEFKRKLEEEYRKQNELIEKKKAELEEKVRDLNNQLYMLETEIYAIRCITGEVVNFTKLTDGRNADAANPVVVYQKLRYLDEEMGKIMALYNFDGEDCRYFEELLKNRADIRDLFCPGDKAVTFVKVSKSGIFYSASDFVANMLDKYEKYHGSTIGILIRDGENLYIGWTDEEKINIRDDNVFFAPKQESVSQETEYAISTTRDEKISRFFIFSILQGLINDGKILRLPEKVQVMKQNPFMSVYDYVESRVRFGYQLKAANGEVLYVKQAYSKKQTKDAKEDVQEYKKLAAKAAVVYNNDRKLYELINGNGQVIGWRGTEEKAKALIKEFSNAKIEKCSFRCPTHIQFYMDEFANIGQVPNFQQKLATIRKYEISCVIILQSLSQLKEMYEKGWQGVTGNCDTTIYLGGNDDETAEWLSKKLGKRTTIVQNESWGTNNTSGNTSFNRSSIELMPASKLLLMPDDDTIVIVRGQRPWYGRKYKCNLHPNYKECMSLEPIEIGAEAERKSKHSKASSNPVIEEKNKKIEETKEDKHDEISASTDENLLSGNDKKSNFKDAMIGFRQKIENLVKKEKTNKGNHEIQASVTLNGQEEENPIEKDMNENKSNVVENAFAVDDIPSLDDIPLDPSASDSMINNSDDFIPEDALLDFPTDNEDPPTFCQTAEDILGMESSMKSDKEWDSTMNKRRKEAAKESSANIDESGDAIISDPEPLSIDNMEKFFGSKDVDKLRETCSSVFNDEEELDMSFAPDEIMYGSTP